MAMGFIRPGIILLESKRNCPTLEPLKELVGNLSMRGNLSTLRRFLSWGGWRCYTFIRFGALDRDTIF
jgi:hypothetical protein